jgi:serine/threonine-protein kinase
MTSAGEIRSADPFLGKVVDGRYRIELMLGAGSIGSVYRAADRVSGRSVALKIWNTPADNEQIRGRFLREAQALSTLRHPNIVDVYGYGMCDVLPYMAMEYLDGRTLEQMLGVGQPLPTPVALDIMMQVLQALAYAHGLDVVHRDLKPENIVLVTGASGYVVKLLDFGLAKFLSPETDPIRGSKLTLHGMVMGTPLYMAPEQAAGAAVDERADVYAAGCVMFEMLTGRPPYTDDTNAMIFRAHAVAPIPQLEAARPEVAVTPEMQGWIDRALAKSPAGRFSDAGEMLEELMRLPRPVLRLRSGMPDNHNATGGAETASARGSRWPLTAALLFGVGTALALAYALFQ